MTCPVRFTCVVLLMEFWLPALSTGLVAVDFLLLFDSVLQRAGHCRPSPLEISVAHMDPGRSGYVSLDEDEDEYEVSNAGDTSLPPRMPISDSEPESLGSEALPSFDGLSEMYSDSQSDSSNHHHATRSAGCWTDFDRVAESDPTHSHAENCDPRLQMMTRLTGMPMMIRPFSTDGS